jgi:hypothetical protein
MLASNGDDLAICFHLHKTIRQEEIEAVAFGPLSKFLGRRRPERPVGKNTFLVDGEGTARREERACQTGPICARDRDAVGSRRSRSDQQEQGRKNGTNFESPWVESVCRKDAK